MSGACQAAQYTTQSALWYNMQRPGEREERTSASTRRAFSTIVAASAVSNLTLDSLPCDSPPPALVSQCLPCLGRHLRHMPLHSAGRGLAGGDAQLVVHGGRGLLALGVRRVAAHRPRPFRVRSDGSAARRCARAERERSCAGSAGYVQRWSGMHRLCGTT